MVTVIIEPYSNVEEKLRIFKENKDIKFLDLGNCLMNLENIGEDEISAAKAIWKEKNN